MKLIKALGCLYEETLKHPLFKTGTGHYFKVFLFFRIFGVLLL